MMKEGIESAREEISREEIMRFRGKEMESGIKRDGKERVSIKD